MEYNLVKVSFLKLLNKGKPPPTFSLACNLMKKDAYCNDFQNIFLTKNPCDCQIRTNQMLVSAEYYEPFSILVNWKDVRDQISKITTTNTSLHVATMSQGGQSHFGASWNVSTTCLVGQSPLSTSFYVARTSQIGRFCLHTSERLQRRLK